MKVIYTDQSYERLEESMNFLLEVQGIPLDKVREIGSKLLDRADSLANMIIHIESNRQISNFKYLLFKQIGGRVVLNFELI